MIDFTPLDDICDKDDYKWMTLHAADHLKVIERLVNEGANPYQIGDRVGRRVGAERQQFVARCEGAARYLKAQKDV